MIAGGQTITTHCLACGDRGELDPRVLPVVEGGSRFTRDRAWIEPRASKAASGWKAAFGTSNPTYVIESIRPVSHA